MNSACCGRMAYRLEADASHNAELRHLVRIIHRRPGTPVAKGAATQIATIKAQRAKDRLFIDEHECGNASP